MIFYVLWRIDGDFQLSELSEEMFNLPSNNDVLIACLNQEYQENETGMTEEELHAQIAMATDTDSPDFIGYEMPMAFLGPDDLQWRST